MCSIGDSGFILVGICVYWIGEYEMKYIILEKGKDLIEVFVKCLLILNYKNFCFLVENKGSWLMGCWIGMIVLVGKKLVLMKIKLIIDGKFCNVSVEEVWVGWVGIMEDGKLLVFFIDVGGDYVVLQWFKVGIMFEVMCDIQREVMDF